MSAFLDEQAVEDDSGDDEPSRDSDKPPPKKKSKKTVQSDDDDEDEDDDERAIAKEMKGFVVEGDDEEEEGQDDKSDKSKDSDDDDNDVDEEDLDLVQSNLGISIQKKNRVRIEDSDEDEEGDAEEVARRRIEHDLFDSKEGEEPEEGEVGEERPVVEAPKPREPGSDSESEQEDESWLVNEEGVPIQPNRRHRTQGLPMSNAQLEEAREIFGVDFEWDEFLENLDEVEEEDEEDEEMDEGDEEGEKRVRRKKMTKESLLSHVEPAEIADGYLADADKRIQLEDRPERFQLRRVPVTECEQQELDAEAGWIYHNAFEPDVITEQEPTNIAVNVAIPPDEHGNKKVKRENVISKTAKALDFMRNQVFEVPFIAFYRKEYIEPELGINDLWKIYQWDEKWCQLLSRRRHLGELFERMQRWQQEVIASDPDADVPDDIKMITDDDFTLVRESDTMEQLADVNHYFDLYHGVHVHKLLEWEFRKALEEGEDRAEPLKKPIRKDPYHVCVGAGLSGFALKFGLSPSQLAANLKEELAMHEVDSYAFHPEDTAQDYVSEQFEDREKVVLGAKFMVAKEMSREPSLRMVIRKRFTRRAMISTKITKKGRKEIDENHPIYTMKYLKNKRVHNLKADEFLKLVQAEENGLITICIHSDYAPDETGKKELDDLADEIISKEYYRRDQFSDAAKAWNKLRDETLEMCINEMLTPMFAKELRTKILQEAKEAVIRESCQKLYNWLQFAAYEADITGDGLDDEDVREALDGAKVLAIAYSPLRDEAAFCAMLDGDGELVDHLRLCHLTKSLRSRFGDNKRRKEEDLEYFRKFVIKRRPHVVALAAENMDALMIKEDLEKVLSELQSSTNLRHIPVEIVDNELAHVYANSKRARSDYPDLPDRLREAISIGRRLQDPLPEFCQMWTTEEEIMCLNFHPLMSMISKEDLLSGFQVELINRVNEVGVQINRCLAHAHTAQMLQFVCGLGPRKAAAILKTLKQNDFLENRTRLVTLCKMGPKVFMNSAGFIRIEMSKINEEAQGIFVEVLDGTRIHPETYEWARKMAIDALEIDEAEDSEVNHASALEEILRTPDKLKDLDLDAFATELERQQFGNKRITLYDIRAELNHRYKDLRNPYSSPSREEIFNLLTKETPATFNVGKLVMGKVMHVVYRKATEQQREETNPVRDDATGFWQCPFCQRKDFAELGNVWTHLDNECPGQAVGVKVRLENGIMGFIKTKYISDKPVTNPADRVATGMPVYCRVLKVDTDRFQADLSCRTSDLLDRDANFRPQKDMSYDFKMEDEDRKEEERAKMLKQRTNYVKRVIAHPNFRNVTFKDAEKILESMDQGDCIIRPSSKGSDHLTVTWKVCGGIYAHVDVREEGKEKAFSLGKQLWIGDDEFEDLDEIVARFVQPMAALGRDILNFKYFGQGIYDKEAVELRLQDEKNRNSSRIPYLITASKALPGKFLLSYLPRTKVKHEYLTVTPEGYKFRRVIHHSLPNLMKWFKDHFRDPIPGGTGDVEPPSYSPFLTLTDTAATDTGTDTASVHPSDAQWTPTQSSTNTPPMWSFNWPPQPPSSLHWPAQPSPTIHAPPPLPPSASTQRTSSRPLKGTFFRPTAMLPSRWVHKQDDARQHDPR